MIDNKQFVYYNSVINVIWGICNGSFKCDYFITDGVYDCVLRLSVQKDGTQRIVLYLCGNVRVRRKPLHDYGGILMIAILYLIVSAAFLGIGFAIDTRQTIAFYCGMGGWFKTTFTNTALIGWRVLSLLLPPAGVVLYFVWYKEKRNFRTNAERWRFGAFFYGW